MSKNQPKKYQDLYANQSISFILLRTQLDQLGSNFSFNGEQDSNFTQFDPYRDLDDLVALLSHSDSDQSKRGCLPWRFVSLACYLLSSQEENETQVGLHNSFLDWSMIFGSCLKCLFQGQTSTECQESCRCLVVLGSTKAMGTVRFLHLLTQTHKELEEKAICPLVLLILEETQVSASTKLNLIFFNLLRYWWIPSMSITGQTDWWQVESIFTYPDFWWKSDQGFSVKSSFLKDIFFDI